MKTSLFFATILLTFSGCDSSFVANYFTKLPTPALIQFGAPSSSVVGQSFTVFSNLDLGSQPYTSQSQSVVYLSNTGELPAGIQKVWVDAAGTNYYSVVQNLCGQTLPAANTPCKLVIGFSPLVLGNTSATLHVAYTDGNGNNALSILPLIGAGNNLAYLHFDPADHKEPIATVNGQTRVIFNVVFNGSAIGASALQIKPATNVQLTNPTDGSFTIDKTYGCGLLTTINANCGVRVLFEPTTLSSNFGAGFDLNYYNGAEFLQLVATVEGSSTLAVTPTVLTAPSSNPFGQTLVNHATPTTETIHVTFAGTNAAEITSIVGPTDTTDFQLSTDSSKSSCYGSTSIDYNCTFFVSFSPKLYQTYTDSITVNYTATAANGTTSPAVLTIPISGKGLHPAILTPGSLTLGFGNQPDHEPASSKSFTFTATGDVSPSAISSVSNSGANSGDFIPFPFTACASSSPCSMTVGFTPSVVGAEATQLSFYYYDGNNTQHVSLSVTGTGTSPLVLTNGSTIDFHNVIIGGVGSAFPGTQLASIDFYGATAGTLTVNPSQLSSPFTFSGGFPGSGGTCSSTVNPTASSHNCSFGVTATSDTFGTDGTVASQGFTLSSGSVSANYTVKMTLHNPPVLQFQTAPAFNEKSVGDSDTEVFTIKNTSAYFASQSVGVTAAVSAPFSITGNTCNAVVNLNSTCQITVKFSPTSANTFSSSLSYTYSDGTTNRVISTPLSAVGTGDVTLAANTTTTIDFGNVFVGDSPAPASQTILFTYYGNKTWTPSISVPAPFTVNTGTCGSAGSCTITIGLNNTAAFPSDSQSVNFSYSPALTSSGTSGTNTIPLTLKANLAYRQATLASSLTAFPNVVQGNSISETLTLSNSGNGPASSFQVTTPNLTNGFSITGGSCLTQTSLGAASSSTDSCTLNVTFTPASVGAVSTPLTVSYVNQAVATVLTKTFTLTASGTQTTATLSINNTKFPKTLKGSSSAPQTLTITNTGNSTGSSLTVNQALTSGFVVNGGTCLTKTSLNAADSCTVIVTFTPTAVGTATTPLIVSATSPFATSPTAYTFNLNGIGTQPILAFAGGYQTCVIDEVGTSVCWGDNSSGQLGQGAGYASPSSAAPNDMPKINFGSGVTIVKFAVGYSHICAILNTASGNGKVSCWGNNASGQLGLGNTTSTNSPLNSSGSLNLVNLGTDSSSNAEVATDLSANLEHTCAVLKSGKIKCWGGNDSGQLGIDSTQNVGTSSSQMGNSLKEVDLNGSTPVSVSAGASHTCAVMSDGGSLCWGDNNFGELGQGVTALTIGGTTGDMESLRDISLGNGLKASNAVSSSGTAFTCVLLTDGTVKCFGETDYNDSFFGVLGQCWARPYTNATAIACDGTTPQTNHLGNYPSDMGDNLPPVALPHVATQLAVGRQFACTLEIDSSVRCWGANDHGQLGVGSTTNLPQSPSDMGASLGAALSTSSGVSPISVVTGDEHACAVQSDNTVKCWGTSTSNATGLAAAGKTTDTGGTSSTTPSSSGFPVAYSGN